jgi:hypothetical protein
MITYIRRNMCELYNALTNYQSSASVGILYIFLNGTAAQRGLWPSRSRGFVTTHNDAPQPVGLLWTSDQLVAETSTWQHTQQKNIHAPGGIFFSHINTLLHISLCTVSTSTNRKNTHQKHERLLFYLSLFLFSVFPPPQISRCYVTPPLALASCILQPHAAKESPPPLKLSMF